MSSSTPGPTDGPTPGAAPEVDYLGERPAASGRKRRTGIVVAGTVAAVAAAGAGAWAVTQFMSGGPSAAMAVPAGALGYVSLDLDPDGGQKIEAVQTLRKFPAIQEELDIDGSEDLQRVLFDALTAEDPCPDLDYGVDLEPWLGGKLAVAAIPGDDEPVPFFVVQVKDEEAATDGIAKIAACGDEEAPGTAFVGDFMVVAETDEIAADVAADAEESSLADDDEFGRWIDEAGGSGILEAYVAAEGAEYLVEMMGSDALPITDEFAATTESSMLEAGAEPLVAADGLDEGPDAAPTPDLEEALEEFDGAAFVVRFDDEALEMEAAGGGLPTDVEVDGESGLGDLPASTALAFGLGVADGAVQDFLDSFTQSSGLSEDAVEEMLGEAEAQSGLELPEDIQALLGDGFSVAVDSSVDMDSMINSSEPPEELPAGIRIVGDPDEITAVIEKLRESAGSLGEEIVVEEGDGVVAVGIDEDYVATLAEDGALGDEERFEQALEDADTGTGGLFVDFDAGDWLTELAAQGSDERIEENVAPLDSLGISGSVEDDTAHWVLRLTTD